MLKLISHRGNLNGVDERYENMSPYIDYAMNRGFDVEIDVWKLPGEDFYRLGHDKPILNQSVNLSYIQNPNLWIHCKNDLAWEDLKLNSSVNCFKHEDEDYVLTTKNIYWVHSRLSPNDFLSKIQYPNYDKVDAIFLNYVNEPKKNVIRLPSFIHSGICSDYIETYR